MCGEAQATKGSEAHYPLLSTSAPTSCPGRTAGSQGWTSSFLFYLFIVCCFNSVIFFACSLIPISFICAIQAARSDLNSNANTFDIILLNFLQFFGSEYSLHSAQLFIFLFLQQSLISHHVAFSLFKHALHFSFKYALHAPQ